MVAGLKVLGEGLAVFLALLGAGVFWVLKGAAVFILGLLLLAASPLIAALFSGYLSWRLARGASYEEFIEEWEEARQLATWHRWLQQVERAIDSRPGPPHPSLAGKRGGRALISRSAG